MMNVFLLLLLNILYSLLDLNFGHLISSLVGAYQRAMERNPAAVRRWDDSGCTKICVKAETESEMMNVRKAANMHGLNYYLVHDAGRTQIAAGSATVLAIGPDLVQNIDQLTGGLKLL